MRAVAVAAVVCAAAAAPASQSLQRIDREVYLMGTRARLETYAAERAQGLTTLDRALAVLEQTEDELSTWREQSAISALNRHPVGSSWHAPQPLCASFAEILRLSHETRRAFDPAIGALIDAWGIHEGGRIPSAAELAAAQRASGTPLLEFNRRACTVTRRGDIRIDVGAWGKGAAIDRLRHAIPDATWLVDLGGQIGVSGLPPGEPAWTVSIAHPRFRDLGVLAVWLKSGSISTSAGSERDVIAGGRRIAHHIDPRTGQPASFNGAVSVWHQSALAADALSTALYVMGPEEGMRWADSRHIAACYLIPGKEGVITRMTSAFKILLAPEG